MDIHETVLPGVGLRHDFTTKAGRQHRRDHPPDRPARPGHLRPRATPTPAGGGRADRRGGRGARRTAWRRPRSSSAWRICSGGRGPGRSTGWRSAPARRTSAGRSVTPRPAAGPARRSSPCCARTGATPSPTPDFRFATGDTLVVVGTREGVAAVVRPDRGRVTCRAQHRPADRVGRRSSWPSASSAGSPAGSAFSPIPLYLLAGLAFGHGGLLPLAASEEFVATGAEIGVILLLFAARPGVHGRRAGRHVCVRSPSGLVDLLLNASPGRGRRVAARLGPGRRGRARRRHLGSPRRASIAKVVGDLGRLGNRETPVVLAILVLEDLAMAVYLPILTALLAGVAARRRQRRVADRAGHRQRRAGRWRCATAGDQPGSCLSTSARCCCSWYSGSPCWSRASPRNCRSRPRSARSWSASRCRARSRTARATC